MKKTWMIKLSGLLLLSAIISGCQEKIAPELSTPASTTTGGGSTTTTSTNRFYITLNKTPTGVEPEDLGYVLHKANMGAGVNCQVDNVVDTPETLDSTRDISCFMEAEEFALYYNGIEFQANTDANTCEYISHEPFSYWNLPPGISRRINGSPRQVIRFNCDKAVVDHLGGSNVPALYGNPSPTYTTVSQLCNKYFNLNDSGLPLPLEFGQLHMDIAPALAGADIQESRLCSYNHVLSDGSEVLCDEGEINIFDVTVSGTDTSDPPDNIPDVISVSPSSPRLLRCGGKVRNCLSGPVVDSVGRSDVNRGIRGIIEQLNFDAGTLTMTVKESFPVRAGNFHSANFMRQCSGVPNYNAANSFTPLPGVEFDPNILQSYSQLGVSTTGTQERDTNRMDVIPLADHPFRGGIPMNVITTLLPTDSLRNYGVNRLSTQPFYSFYCLDHAYDIKARIRVAVREWNRNFSPTTQNFQFVSDVYNRALPFSTRTKMDAGSPVTLLEYPTVYDDDATNNVIDFNFNNLMDWDDLLSFTNSPTGTCGTAINVDGSWVTPLAQQPKSSFWFPSELTD